METLIISLFKELRQLTKGYRSGKIPVEEFREVRAAIVEHRKQLTLQLSSIAEALKYARSMHIQKELKHAGLLSSGQIADMSLCEIEQETVLCEMQDKVITRQECLDRSGSQEHFDECKGCEIGIICKKLLISNPPLYTA